MSNPRASLPTRLPPPAPRKSSPWLLVSVVGGCLAVAVIVIGGLLIFGPSPPPVPPAASQPEPPAVENKAAVPEKPPVVAEAKTPADDAAPVIDDDGKTLWVSPTNGKPVDLAYLSPGAQVIICLRPADLLKNAEGEKVRAALGPEGQSAADAIEKVTTFPLTEIERLVIGCQTTNDNQWLATLVVRTAKPIAAESLRAKLSSAAEKEYGGTKYWLARDHAYFLPGGDANRVLVVAPEDAIHDVIDLAGQTPPLRRDIERLIDNTDGDRHVTIIFAPNSLFTPGQSIFKGEMSRLRDPLFWFLGDELSGAALSMHWDANFFFELIATPTLETSTEKASRVFAERVAQIPDKLEQYVVNLNAQPYGRLVIARFPEMLRKLATYTRSGFEKDHVVLRCYLPAVGGHNLLLAAELTLAEQPGSSLPPANATAAGQAKAPDTSTSVKDRLAKVTSLKFARDTLESALEQLSQDIGAPIVIRGPDLQADGITKNQSFGIDVSDKPAAEILVEILRLANPDKAATGPNDKRQKLVYVVEAKPDQTEQIVVTTRAKAAERKQDLPAPFRVDKP